MILSIAGCSKEDSSKWITSDGTNIYIAGDKTYMTKFDGVSGIYEIEGDPIIVKYNKCVEHVRDCPENRQGVHEADLSQYKKVGYFDAYINTFSVMHTVAEEGTTKEANISTKDKELKSLDSVRPEVYNTLMNIKFEPILTSTFNNNIIIDGKGSSLVVRSTDITVPGVLSVFKGTKECTQQVEIGDITVMKYESNNFNFYQYGDSLIKISKEYNVEDYITLKTME